MSTRNREHRRRTAFTTRKEIEQMSAKRTAKRLIAFLSGAVAAALAIAALAAPALAAEPVLQVDSTHYPATVAAGTYAKYTLKVSNGGDESTSGEVIVDFAVPSGMEIAKVDSEQLLGFLSAWSCTIAGDARSASCTGPSAFGPIPIEPGNEACREFFGVVPSCRLFVLVKVGEELPPGTQSPSFEACGGGAGSCFTGSDPIEVGPPPKFELTEFDGVVTEEDGTTATRAGSHPYEASTEFGLSRVVSVDELDFSAEQLQDSSVELPPGLVGNPQALPTCAQAQLLDNGGECPGGSQVGVVHLRFNGEFSRDSGKQLDEVLETITPVFNMEPGYGTPALFAFNYQGAQVEIYVQLRSGKDYGLTVLAKNAPQTLPLAGLQFEFWGVPAASSHDSERFCGFHSGCSSEADPNPFLTLPTSCSGPVRTSLSVTSWQGGSDSAGFLSHAAGEPENLVGGTGCDEVPFEPALEARPTTNVADSASGLDVDLHIPQHNDPCTADPSPPPALLCETASAELRDTTVTLPEGLVVNPSGANGLGGCSEAQFGYTSTDPDGTIHTTPDAATCPDAAKQGAVEIETPLLDHPLKGAVYLADPYANPFNSLLALYIAVNDPRTGLVVKLAGEVQLDPSTGRITASFDRNPQQPFEDFKLRFFGGAGGALRTPATCGNHTTTSDLVPWTAPEGETKHPSDTWAITQSPGGGCATSTGALPNSPSFDAGTITPVAGSYSPFVIHLRREDGSQEFSAVDVSPPPGLIGKLAGIPYCPDAALAAAAGRSGNEEKAHPDCGDASRVGTVDIAAGAGPAPYHAQAAAYLAGPYKGAPLCMAIVTPATAGPFDLGTVVTRVALQIDPQTAQITAKSDPIPRILEGIPLDVRAVNVELDREKFTKNPTSCEAMSVGGDLLSTLNQSVSLKQRFQLGECGQPQVQAIARPAPQGPGQAGQEPAPRHHPGRKGRRSGHRRDPGHPAALGLPRPVPHPHRLHQGPVGRRRLPGGLGLRTRQRRHADPRLPADRQGLPALFLPQAARPGARPARPGLPADPHRTGGPHRLGARRAAQHLRLRPRRALQPSAPGTVRGQARPDRQLAQRLREHLPGKGGLHRARRRHPCPPPEAAPAVPPPAPPQAPRPPPPPRREDRGGARQRGQVAGRRCEATTGSGNRARGG